MLKKYLEALKNIIFVPLCLSCEERIAQGFLCAKCEEKITFLLPPLCRYCSRPIGENATHSCKECQRKIYPYRKIISTTAYHDPLVNLIHLFKYKNCQYLGNYLSSLMKKHLAKIGFNTAGYDLMTSVPMHKDKIKMRGYNQAEILGRLLANYFKIPFRNDIIYDISIKPSQTKFKPQQRQENVKGAFIVKEDLRDKKIILIDDIFTTGATVKSCCSALKEKGADVITVITLSKTLS
jgi:ComF family protein